MAKHKPCGRLSKSSKGRARELDADDDDASYEPSVREDTPEPKQLATPKSNRRDLSSKTKEPTPPAVAVAASAADEQNGVNTSGSFTPHQAPRPQPSQQLPVRGYTVEELDMTANELYVVEDSQNSPLEFAGYPAHLAPVEVEETSRPKTPTPATTEGSILDETSDSTEAEPAFEDIDMMPCSPIVQQPAEKRPEARLGAFTSKQTLTEAQNAYIQQAPRTLLDPASAVKPLPQARDLVDTTNDTTISDVARQFNLNEAKTGVRNFLEALERIERLPSPLRSFILGRYDMDFSQLTLADIPEIARSLHRSAARQEEEIKEGELRQQRSPRKMLAVA